MTRVEEWTSEDTGVGAAIAAGSHALNGSWALFVIAPANKINITHSYFIISEYEPNISLPSERIEDSEKITKISPNRLVIIVNIPAFPDLSLP